MCFSARKVFACAILGGRVSTKSKSENRQASLVESRQKEAGSSRWWSRFLGVVGQG